MALMPHDLPLLNVNKWEFRALVTKANSCIFYWADKEKMCVCNILCYNLKLTNYLEMASFRDKPVLKYFVFSFFPR